MSILLAVIHTFNHPLDGCHQKRKLVRFIKGYQ